MKYMGSKAKIAKDLLPIIHNALELYNLDTYLEPFCGGCNLIDKVQCNNKIASDKNKYLIALWKHLQRGGKLLDSVSRELYCDVKENINTGKYEDWLIANVGFLASFNGRWFDACYSKPGYEVKNGKYYLRDYYQEAKRNILAQVDNIKDIEFYNKDYRDWNPDKCLIYCDPPYINTMGYKGADSDTFNHKEFWDKVKEWSKNNIVLVSEMEAPDEFDVIWERQVDRTINARHKYKVTERLFTYESGLE